VIRSLNTAERAMEMEQVRIGALANNLANVNSAGFKQILTRVGEPAATKPADGRDGTVPAQAQAKSGRTTAGDGNWAPVSRMDLFHAVDMRPGPINATGRDTDVAIMGPGFFEISTPDGPRYTRDGSFSLNALKQLTTPGGMLVQGDGGPITIDGNSFTIAADGTINVDGKSAGQLKLMNFSDPTRLEHQGDSLLKAPEALEATPLARTEVVVAQAHLEGSNVNPIDTLVAMISAQRAFEVQSTVLKTEDEMLSKSVNNLPRANG
jgi:flagellar basal-body rod protein FlgG